MIPAGFIQDLLSRIDIVEIVGRHVELKKAGINHKGLCPFHGEKTPSFIVSPTRQTYHCFGCGVHGNAVGFLMEHSGLGFVEAVKDLAQQAGMQVPEEERSPQQIEHERQQKQKQQGLTDVLLRASEHYRKHLKASPRAIDYLKRRGLTGAIAARFGLGYAPEGWRALASAFPRYDDPQLVEAGLVITQGDENSGEEQRRYDRFRDRIMFPIRNVQGETIGFGGRILDKGEPKYLNSPETPVFSKGRELYGLFEGRQGIRRRGHALVVEGYMDVVALAQHGFDNAVATLGTACTAEHVQKLFRFTESVVFSFDGDAAGRRAASRALEAALPHASDTRSIRFLFLPTEHDPDSYVRELGAEAFEHCISEAWPLSRQLLEVAAEDCDLSTAEGRARMLSRARPLWTALPTGLLKRQLLGDLARRGQMPDAELQQIWDATDAASASRGRKDGPGGAAPGHSRTTHTGGPPPTWAVRGGTDGGAEWHDMPEMQEPPAFDETEPHSLGHPATEPRPPRNQRAQGEKKPWRADRGKDWKLRREQEADETFGTPRRAPASPLNHALRMLLLNSAWWNELSADEQHMLHELPGEQGQLVAWLERHLVNHGPSAWSALAAALQADGLWALAERACAGLQVDDEPLLDDFRLIVRRLWITALENQAHQLSTSPITPATLETLKALRLQIQALKTPTAD